MILSNLCQFAEKEIGNLLKIKYLLTKFMDIYDWDGQEFFLIKNKWLTVNQWASISCKLTGKRNTLSSRWWNFACVASSVGSPWVYVMPHISQWTAPINFWPKSCNTSWTSITMEKHKLTKTWNYENRILFKFLKLGHRNTKLRRNVNAHSYD